MTPLPYDALGHRVQKAINSGAQYFLYDLAGHAVVRMDGNGNWIVGELYAGSKPLATYGGSTTTFDHADWLGTERARTNVSAGLCESMLSLPFGDGFSTSGSCSDMSPLHFTGKEHDYESNLENFGARYYNSVYGRFVTPDWSSVPAPVPYADLTNPQSLNQYVIVRDNPKYLCGSRRP
jgi:RHS repeat-associated protein